MADGSIVEWYQNQTVFITGGTGFLGKALIFKLLQVGCSKIYVLIRPKKGTPVELRLDAILQEEVRSFMMLFWFYGFTPD